jgi:hypothetical protein
MKVLVRVQLASLSEGGNGKRGLKSDYGQIKGDREAGEDYEAWKRSRSRRMKMKI